MMGICKQVSGRAGAIALENLSPISSWKLPPPKNLSLKINTQNKIYMPRVRLLIFQPGDL